MPHDATYGLSLHKFSGPPHHEFMRDKVTIVGYTKLDTVAGLWKFCGNAEESIVSVWLD